MFNNDFIYTHKFETRRKLYIAIFCIYPSFTLIYFTQTNPPIDGPYILSNRRRKFFYIYHKSNNRKALRRKPSLSIVPFLRQRCFFYSFMDSQVGYPSYNHSNNRLSGGRKASSDKGCSGLKRNECNWHRKLRRNRLHIPPEVIYFQS